tara:strand:- start:42 stop:1082 length:1041 start_codon:yes stop_codon:yes gene_type:complete
MAEQTYHGIADKKEALKIAQKRFDAGETVGEINANFGYGRWPNSEGTKTVDWRLQQSKGKVAWADDEKFRAKKARGSKTRNKLQRLQPETEELFKSVKLPEGKSVKGFKKYLTSAKKQAEIERDITRIASGQDQDIGHGLSIGKGGSDAISNTSPESSKRNQEIREHSGRKIKDLDEANISSTQKKAALNYLIDGEPKLDAGTRTKIHQGEQDINKIINYNEQPEVKVKKNVAKRTFRILAKTAGRSNNPLANIGGDLVGVLLDGAAYASNPNMQTGLDLLLSGSEAITSVGALGLAAVPIPGSRVAAFALMKVGDNINKAQQIMNLGREGLSLKGGSKRSLKLIK